MRKAKAKKIAAFLALPEVRLRDLKPGDILITDGDFTCTRHFAEHVVQQGPQGLYIRCRSGGHNLDGQLACDGPEGKPDDDTLVGLRRPAPVAP